MSNEQYKNAYFFATVQRSNEKLIGVLLLKQNKKKKSDRKRVFFCQVLVRERESKGNFGTGRAFLCELSADVKQSWADQRLPSKLTGQSDSQIFEPFCFWWALSNPREAFPPSLNYIQLGFPRGLTANQRNPPAARLPVCLPTGVLAKCFTSRFRISQPHSAGSRRIQGSDP